MGSPETSVRNYHYTLPNSPQEVRSMSHISLFFVSQGKEYGAKTFLSRKIMIESAKMYEKNVQLYIQRHRLMSIYACTDIFFHLQVKL